MSLYKYVEAARVDILQNGYIRFTPQSGLNDAFEMRPFFDSDHLSKTPLLGEGEITMTPTTPGSANSEHMDVMLYSFAGLLFNGQMDQNFREEYDVKINAAYGVLCLTERPDNLLMWGHYADGHRGFVIEFDENHPFFNQKSDAIPNCGTLQKVEYSKHRPSIKMAIDIRFIQALFTKSEDWQYEREWRIVRLLHEADEVKEHPTTKARLHFFNFPPDCIKRVIFGCKMPAEARQNILDIVKSDARYNAIELSRAVINERAYNLDIINF